MPSSLDQTRVVELFFFFFSIVFLRTQATYWLARYVAHVSTTKTTIRNPILAKAAHWIRVSGEGKGVKAVHRWGLLAVFFSFFMTGTKTVVNAAAGLIRMRFWVWIWPMLLGCVVHGIIYATIGWAAWTAALKATAGSPWGAAAILLVIAFLACWWGRKRRKARIARETAVSQAIDDLDSPHDSSE